MARGSLTAGLNGAQRAAVESTDGPVLILAGAGTGKTRTVTHRMARMLQKGIQPSQILAVTFTNKAATEMRERVGGLVRRSAANEMTVCTFHSLCVRILRQHAGRLGYKSNFSIAAGNDRDGLVKQLIVRHGGAKEKLQAWDVLAAVSQQKNAGLAVGEIPDDLIRTVAMSYQSELRARNSLDFDDLLLLGEQLMREFEEVRDYWRDRYRYVTVDEFQDTNGLQMALLQSLVGPPYHVCVVGDDDQSIYGWRGAQVANILQFERFFPDPRVVRLEDNYRSTEAILAVANSVIRNNPARHEKALRATVRGGEKVQVMSLPGDDEEAQWVAGEVKRSRDRENRRWEDYAVLFRTNTQIRRMEQAMREAQIPYRVLGAQSFYDRREVRDVLAFLQAAVNPDAEVALLRILNTPPRGIGTGTATLMLESSRERECSVWETMNDEEFLAQLSTKAGGAVRGFARLMENFGAALRERPWEAGEALRRFLDEADYLAWMMRNCKTDEERDQRREAVGEVVAAVADAMKKKRGMQDFLDSAALDAEPDDEDLESKTGVSLITLHAAKGLEFPVVFLVGLEEGVLPHKRSVEEGSRDEERRLLYVGITRARERLFLSYCGFRKRYGEKVRCEPSSFLDEVDLDWIEERDFETEMNTEATGDELQDFLGSMRALLD
ncbi:MAG: UvrD-helicase domain-containing protein [Akkermansiaceae bacterium]|nr:UvrD-helicase domain-containing protein [Akkermansiaceae bacterium]NNM28119.1 UvrD-helicase domain-containing protein [Akkermansiaceae bacterium]